jgi:putrescine importer
MGGTGSTSGGLASTQPFFNDTSSFATISAGAAIAAYSFLGFDAVTTLTEETVEPRKNMPRAIMLIALIGDGIFVTVSYVTQLVHPGGVFEDSASAASSIALQIGGQLFGAVFLAGLVVAQFASGLAAQASASRLLYAMGRGSVLPKAVFGRLSSKFHTPVVNLIVTGIIGLIAIFLDVATSTSCISFGGAPAEPRVLHGGPGGRSHHLRLPALPAGQQRHYAGIVLAGAGRGGPGPDHAGIQGGAAGDDGHGKGDG